MNGTSLLAKEIAEELARILAPLVAKEMAILPPAKQAPQPVAAPPPPALKSPPQPAAAPQPPQSSAYVTEYEVAKMYSISVSTLRRWRLVRKGPPYFKIGSSVRYLAAELGNWAAAANSIKRL